jgi:hypothetical protein
LGVESISIFKIALSDIYVNSFAKDPRNQVLPPPRGQSVLAACAGLRLATIAHRQTLVNAQSVRVVSLGAVGTVQHDRGT